MSIWRALRNQPRLDGAAISSGSVLDPHHNLLSEQPNPRIWFEILAILCIGVLPDVVSALRSLFLPPPQPSPTFAHYGYLISRSVFVSYAVLYMASVLGRSRNSFGLSRPRLVDVPLGAGLVVICGVARLALSRVPVHLGPFVHYPRALPLPLTVAENSLTVIGVAMNSFAEELVVRGLLVSRVRSATGSPLFAVAFSAACYAAYHVYQGIGPAIGVFVSGVVMASAFLIVQRVWPFVVWHFIWDMLGIHQMFHM